MEKGLPSGKEDFGSYLSLLDDDDVFLVLNSLVLHTMSYEEIKIAGVCPVCVGMSYEHKGPGRHAVNYIHSQLLTPVLASIGALLSYPTDRKRCKACMPAPKMLIFTWPVSGAVSKGCR